MDYDSISYTFTFLDIKSLISCSIVCKQFNEISKNELIWKRLFNEKYHCIIKHNKYLINYQNIYELDKFLMKYIGKDISHTINEITIYLHANQLQSIPIEIGHL